jgi:hypothetical protein
MKQMETKFLKEIYSSNEDRNNEPIISRQDEKEMIIIQQQTGQPGSEETEDIFESYYNNRFD